jgi:hypothetical protein
VTRRVLFLHIPKTGGVSIESMIRGVVPGDRIAPPNPAHILSDTDWRHADEYEYFFSHVPAYIDQILPRPLFTFTFLRDPVDRAISAYNHMLRADGSPIQALVVDNELTFADALTHPETAPWLCNVATRILGLDADLVSHFPDGDAMELEHRAAWSRPAGEATLANALERLESLDFVGLTECIARDGTRLARALGLPAATVPHENQAPVEHAHANVTATRTRATEAAVREHSPFDFVVYERARGIGVP